MAKGSALSACPSTAAEDAAGFQALVQVHALAHALVHDLSCTTSHARPYSCLMHALLHISCMPSLPPIQAAGTVVQQQVESLCAAIRFAPWKQGGQVIGATAIDASL